MKLRELEQKYNELGAEIKRLKAQEQFKLTGCGKGPLFLLSKEEYQAYKDKIPHIKCCWWLRSSGNERYDLVDTVCADGTIKHSWTNIRGIEVGVRPVLNLRYLSDSHYGTVADGTVFDAPESDNNIVACGTTWVKIDEDMYIAEMPIDFDIFDTHTNLYDDSIMRHRLLNWFEARKFWQINI